MGSKKYKIKTCQHLHPDCYSLSKTKNRFATCCCWCCVRANTETCYCQYIHNMLLWACKKNCCCKYSIHESPRSRSIQVVRWRVSEARWETAAVSTSHIFECWAESSLATDTGENQSAVSCDHDVIRSDLVRPIELRHLERHARTMYIS